VRDFPPTLCSCPLSCIVATRVSGGRCQGLPARRLNGDRFSVRCCSYSPYFIFCWRALPSRVCGYVDCLRSPVLAAFWQSWVCALPRAALPPVFFSAFLPGISSSVPSPTVLPSVPAAFCILAPLDSTAVPITNGRTVGLWARRRCAPVSDLSVRGRL
jgi:hypothetical protein